MKKYAIYKIVCNDVNVKYTYVGSTKNFNARMRLHKSNSKRDIKAHMKIYQIINDHGGWDNWSMVIFETIFCESKAEAVEIERKYYDEINENKMNTYRPMITNEEFKENQVEYKKQYYIDNKIAITEIRKEYYDKNKEKIAAYAYEKFHCDVCDCCNNRGDIARHNKSQRHQKNVNKNTY
jgi:hypothetical protein